MMENAICVTITLANGVEALYLVETLNPDAAYLNGMDVTVRGTSLGGTLPGDTKFNWKPSFPILIPKGQNEA